MESPKKILVICSDADLSDLYREILELSGFSNVERVGSVPLSMDMLGPSYDIVVLDCRDLKKELSSLKKMIGEETKVLCVATEAPEGGRTETHAITKPFDVGQFINTIIAL